ncbi:MAG TPA: FkbM family methyltransferase [Nitrospirae bacterium]|nr:2-O-methyltransferase NoeI [bacterium BMS3Abin10]GBE39250.1 2-O-methyltransferase NoeI [bacterium BMS3Bbin08]HDH01050.1 FkbM family methyltransferase [Nitrospirota bacterium]HDH51542.1 FkbM family methyltransferase [Nitrospirota bacterium]HDK82434.1 FkbM family methyltransferase [Nitrospirota bacterium]
MKPYTLPPKHRKALWYFAKAPSVPAKLSVVRFFLKRILRDLGFRIKIDDELIVSIDAFMIHFVPFWGELIHYKEIFADKVYEQHPMFNPENCRTIFDCGANIGLYTLRAAQNRSAKIYAFEPNPSVFQRLVKNVKANDLSNVTALPLAIGSINGKTTLTWDSSTLSGKVVKGRQAGQNEVEVEVTTLDRISEMYHVTSIDILKLDVEGQEHEALKGGTQTLKKTKKLVLEYHNDKVRAECESFLKEAGFDKVMEIPGHQYYINANVPE